MKKYNPKKIEAKWRKKWQKSGIYKNYGRKKKFYALDMFPYPSGAGLHVGHSKGYVATDVVSRYKMLQGFSVLHPMGWDAFGLPAENYAIKHKVHPRSAVKKNIATFKKQLEKFGFTYDWDREINTTDPEYYKWTQWIFLKMFEKGLAYESEEPVNWCPSCKTVLANEDLENGLCERCGTQVVQKKTRQWVLKMTEYADRLLYDLDKEKVDWEESIMEQQKNWIGRSEGTTIEFEIKISNSNGISNVQIPNSKQISNSNKKNSKQFLEVFTTRLDTIFGCTYCVIAPEHPIVASLLKNQKLKIKNIKEIKNYIIQSQNKTELERMETKEKTGVELKGVKATNPFTNEEVPIFAADYVLGGYGTGAVMAVPAHDERDFEFAKKYKLEIIETVISKSEKSQAEKIEKPFIGDGILTNSGKYTGMASEKARSEMAKWLEKNKLGEKKINYKMRDWVFSRQRYWGEPFPLIFCPNCKKLAESSKSQIPNSKQIQNQKIKIQNTEFSLGEILNPGWIAIPEKYLPVKLPEVKSYKPTGIGEPPLAGIKKWVNTKCPKCGGPARRETNTMPQWAGSSWYYLRYIDSKNNKALVDKKKEKKWIPVDLYVGGAEHATRHLLYARFWHKFLYDIGAVSTDEPFKKLVHVGLINAEDGRKMSKRWNNVINPDDVIAEFGADSIRLYEMFMGPFTQNIAWSTAGVSGTRRFLEKVYKLRLKAKSGRQNQNPLVHKTIKKVTEDIENFRFNTAISAMMILTNEMEKEKFISIADYESLIKILSPFAPHIAEELWEELGNKKSVFLSSWPRYNPRMIKEEKIELVVQVNGKLRDKIKVSADIAEEEAKQAAFQSEKIKSLISGKEIRKTIFIKGKLINIVV